MLNAINALVLRTMIHKGSLNIRRQGNQCYVANKNEKLRNLPIVRGVVNFIESLSLGMKTLMYSASFFEDEEDTAKKENLSPEEKKKMEEKEKKEEKLLMSGTLAFSVVFALLLFFALPYFLSGFFHKVIASETLIALIEGLIRLVILRLNSY